MSNSFTICGGDEEIFQGESGAVHGFFTTKWRVSWSFKSGAVNPDRANNQPRPVEMRIITSNDTDFPVKLRGKIVRRKDTETEASRIRLSAGSTGSVSFAWLNAYIAVGQEDTFDGDGTITVDPEASFGASGEFTMLIDFYTPKIGYSMQDGEDLLDTLENLTEFPGKVEASLPNGIGDGDFPDVKFPDAEWEYSIERIY